MDDCQRKVMKKIGIFLMFAPDQTLLNHGIGRLLCFIVAAAANSVQIVVAAPKWYKNAIIELFKDHNIDPEKIEILTTTEEPCLIKAKDKVVQLIKSSGGNKKQAGHEVCNNEQKDKAELSVSHNSAKSNQNPIRLLIQKMENFLFFGLASPSWKAFLASVIFVVALSPFLLIAFLGNKIIALFKGVAHQTVKLLKNIINRYFSSYKKYLVKPTFSLKIFKNNKLARKTYDVMYKQEVDKLIKIINTREDIKLWFSPTIFWPEVTNIKALKVATAPDIVFLDFPTQFNTPLFYKIYRKIQDTIKGVDHLICYSDYVKNAQLTNRFPVNEESVTVIKHGLIDLKKYLVPKEKDQSTTQLAKDILKKYRDEKLQENQYLKDFDFSDVKFIFYSSQMRQHKNFLNLIKAYEILLRERYLGIKLIVTASLDEDKNVAEYVKKRRLQYDILSFHNIPSEVLAAVNHLAVCVVNPTLFEGGFPFTFSEAYSVGTPSIMSSIPVTEELIDSELLKEKMLFDPYDVKDMVEKIAWGIEHRNQLYEIQKPLYDKFIDRSWSVVANEYLKVFERVVNNESK